MKITVLTLFPHLIKPYIETSIIKKAQEKKIVSFSLIDIRKFAKDRHKTVDDRPFGGGKGMLIKIDVLVKALNHAKLRYKKEGIKNYKIILLDPSGPILTQRISEKYTNLNGIILIAGRYEGIDARIIHFIDEKISLGKFILTGGELPALCLIDSVVRLIPDVLDPKTINEETFSEENVGEYPQYTRPVNFKGFKVPQVLLCGDHKKVAEWKKSNRTSLISAE